ncbi:HipA family kinase [Catalinimonas alkaloidigena]|uniref:HipA family kinase n=1 Tax=Catalinimonas alkaloidigena TaxID=1075417 RepID=UPI0024058E7A|nr:HipA family kinase [Catalinimonas alkaloidigena]
MNYQPEIRTVNVIRYVTPLREGGSLPALVEADDEFLYVLKFRGAGQGAKALIAELLAGEIARVLGFRVPEIVFAELDATFGRSEGDEEIQDLLRGSEGLNLALHYLSGAINFNALVTPIEARLASQIVWFDGLVMNVDRTTRNTNMLTWHKELWLIDHGASFYFHHSWQNPEQQALRPFAHIKDHVLLAWATELEAVDTDFKSRLTTEHIRAIVSLIPDAWLLEDSPFESLSEHRDAYINFLVTRLSHTEVFIKEAQNARKALV